MNLRPPVCETGEKVLADERILGSEDFVERIFKRSREQDKTFVFFSDEK